MGAEFEPHSYSSHAADAQERSVPGAFIDGARSLAAPLLCAAAFVALFKAGAALDRAVNPDIVKAIEENFHWWRSLTSSHVFTVIDQMYPLATTAFYGVFGGIYGAVKGWRR